MTREEAWNRIDAIIARHEIDDDYVTITSFLDYDALRMARKELEQEPRKGKWEYDANKDKSGGHCNKCGHFLRYGEKTNFCPDCGAEMSEVEE